jgi:hypothetical protein
MRLLPIVSQKSFAPVAKVSHPFGEPSVGGGEKTALARGIVTVLLTCLFMLSTAACGRETPPADVAGGEAVTAAPTGSEAGAESAENETTAPNLAEFDPANFDNPTTVTNEWMPLTPGTHFVYEGTTVEDDGEAVPHRIEVTITDLTKVIGDIDTVVSWDLDYTDNELVEAELAFYAQDKEGNVWRMGEYPEEYDTGELVVAPTWIHGLADARAGIHMLADPQPGTPSYAQGWGPAVDWTDQGQVDQVGQETCVPVDCYKDVLVIAETSQSEPDAFQLKYYARGVGNVRVGWRGEGEKTQEVLELVEYSQLSPEELAAARTEVLKLEQSAYENSKDVYAQTPPIASSELPADTAGASVATDTQAAETSVATPSAEIVVYTADLPESALYEFEVWEDAAAVEGELLGVTNYGDELDAPPENDPHVLFDVAVQAGMPYRCWVHMLVGAPNGKSQANVLWVQFSDAVDKDNNTVFQPETASYLTVQGPPQEGWTWAPCALADAADGAASLVYFANSGEVTVRIQAGMEGVGFDQFVLSSAQFLENSPDTAIVKK